MKRPTLPKQLTFQSKLERLAEGINYFALSVPAKISQMLGIRGPVPVSARVNDSQPFLVSLHPTGGGRHSMRVKASVRKEAGIDEGDRARVRITVIDRSGGIALPKDLIVALKAEGMLETFKSLPKGQQSYTLRLIDEAARPETRAKRIQAAVESAHERREKKLGR
jgi:hypothetical protein